MGAESFLTLQIVDFAEGVDDRVAALLTAGTGITLTYNDGAGTLTIASTVSPTWGSIGGTLSSQTDLQAALNAKMGGSTGSTDNRILRADGTGGATVQNSAVTIDDSGNISGLGSITCTGTIQGTGIATLTLVSQGIRSSRGFEAASNDLFYWTSRAVLASLSDGVVQVRNFNGTSGVVFDVATTNGTVRLRDLTNSAAGNLNCGAITASGEILTIAGSKSSPSIRLGATATNTGIYGSTTGTSPGFGFSVAGAAFIATGDAGTGFCLNSAWGVCWTSGQADGTVDTALRRSSAGVVEINNGTAGTRRDLVARNITASALMMAGVYTVGTLPSAAANAGALAQVTDSSVTTNGSAVSGSGSNRVVVFSNGSTWDVVVA